jgi:hypothetical protein
MSSSFTPFDAYGKVREFDDAEVALLSEEEQDALANLLGPCRAAEAAERDEIAARDNVRLLMVAHDKALANEHAANPPTSPVEAARAWSAATNPHLPKAKPKKVNVKVRQALQSARDELATARLDWIKSQGVLQIKNTARATAIVEWMQSQRPVTNLEIAREYAARSNAARMANVKAGLPPEGAKPEPVYGCELERVLQQRGRQNRQRVPGNLKAIPGSGLPIVKDIYKAR